ncbi:MAG: ABC transporter permease subunit [Candidatus Thorarchaeota archaeon]
MQGPDIFGIVSAVMAGIPVTLLLTAFGLSFGFLLGLLLAIVRVYSKDFGFIAEGYEKLVRGIPVLVIIYILYFGFLNTITFLPEIARAFFSASLALGIASAAFQSQIIRGAILSVNPGQIMAARSIGMSNRQALLHVVLPQALRLALPAWSNEYALVIKDAAFASAIGIADMVRLARNYYANEPAFLFIAYVVVALVYLVLTYPVTHHLGERQTRKLARIGLGGK